MVRDQQCPQCEKSFSKMGIGSHIWRVHGEGVGFAPGKGKQVWNRGKTACDFPQLSHSEETKELLRQRMTGKILSRERRERIRASVQRRVKNKTWHHSFSYSRIHLYRGIKLYGMWEVKFAEYLDALHINWIRPERLFPYEFENKIRYYTPDFYIVDADVYVEIKGYRTAKDDAKWKAFPDKLLVLRGENLVELGLEIKFKACL